LPYLHLVDYSDVMPLPGARMAVLAALGLASYLAGLWWARRVWSTDRAWPRVHAEAWRRPRAFVVVVAVALGSLAVLAGALKVATMVPLLEPNKEVARWAFTAKLGYPANAATRLPIIGGIASGLYLLVVARNGSFSRRALAALLVAASMAAEALLGHRGLPL